MPYKETHEIEIGPITLPAGVTVAVSLVPATGGQQAVTITATTSSSRADTAALLALAFAELMTAASAEGVGQPVFQAPVTVSLAPPVSGVTP